MASRLHPVLCVCRCLLAKFRERVVLGAHVMRTDVLPKMQDFLVLALSKLSMAPFTVPCWQIHGKMGEPTWPKSVIPRRDPMWEEKPATKSPSQKISPSRPRRQIHQMFDVSMIGAEPIKYCTLTSPAYSLNESQTLVNDITKVPRADFTEVEVSPSVESWNRSTC